MLRCLKRFILTASQELGIRDLKDLLFRSDSLSNQDLVYICKRISMMSINDIRIGIGKEEFIKYFINSLKNKVSHMDTSDMISIIKDLTKNPDFRDSRNTSNLWPITCKHLINRIDGITINQASDILNSLSFIRLSNSIFENLIEGLEKRLSQFDHNDFSTLTLTRYSSLLWALNHQKINLPNIYSIIAQSLFNHRDFEYKTYEQISMLIPFFYMNKCVPNPDLIVSPLIEPIKLALENDNISSTHELIEVIYFITQIPNFPDRYHEIMSNLLILRQDQLNSIVTICRIISSSLKFTEELKIIMKKKIIENLKNAIIVDLVDFFQSKIIAEASQEKEEILAYISSIKHEISSLPFSKLEKMLNSMYVMELDDLKKLFCSMENFLYEAVSNRSISESFLLRVMKIVMRLNINSKILRVFSEKITSKNYFIYFHTRDMMNLAIIISGIESLQDQTLLNLIDNKAFNYSHLFEFHELVTLLYCTSRSNLIGIETQELVTKRLTEKDLNQVYIDSFTLLFASAVMNNSSLYLRKILPILKLLMQFKTIGESNGKLGGIIKKIDNEFDISLVSLIRCLWFLAYLDIKDSRIINSELFRKIKDVIPDLKSAKEKFIPNEASMDSFHLSILIQSLGIIGKEHQIAQEYFEKILKILEEASPCFDPESTVYSDIEIFCNNLKIPVERNRSLYGNTLPLWVKGHPVVVLDKNHYRYQTYIKDEPNSYSNIRGFFLMRKKFWDCVGVKNFEIEASVWNSWNFYEKKTFISNIFS